MVVSEDEVDWSRESLMKHGRREDLGESIEEGLEEWKYQVKAV